jgi:hypothetical protein
LEKKTGENRPTGRPWSRLENDIKERERTDRLADLGVDWRMILKNGREQTDW